MNRIRIASVAAAGLGLAVASVAQAASAPLSAPAVDRALHAAAVRPARATADTPRDIHAQALIGTPAGFTDPAGDTTLAPDLQGMAVGVTDTGALSVLIRLDSNALIPGDAVATYIDADGNPATGSATFDGADIAVMILGAYGTDSVGMARWDGARMSAIDTVPSLRSLTGEDTDEFWTASLAELGITPGTRIGVRFATIYTGTYRNYVDWAPEPGQAPFGVDIPAPAPPPAPVTPAPVTPAPVAPVTPPAPVTPAPAAPATTVPSGAAATADAPAVAINGFRVRRTGGDVAVRVAWGGATTLPVAYRLAVRCGRRTRNFGGFATKGAVIARTIPVRRACGRSPVRVTATLGDGTMAVTAVRTAW